MDDFKLILVAAYMEAGGNTLQRHLDGHPDLIHAPFETQLGTKLGANLLSQLYHFRYSWPVIPSDISAIDAYHLLFDEETKTYLRTRDRSKFRECGMEANETKRIERFCAHLNDRTLNRANIAEAYFRSTFESWQNHSHSGKEGTFVGYYPLATMDADTILSDLPQAHIIHITRNPWSSWADTIKRPYPLSLTRYAQGWNVINTYAEIYKSKYRDRFYAIRFEDLIRDKRGTLEPILDKIGVGWSDACLEPSWNSVPMKTIFPWGTIRRATTEENQATAGELTAEQADSIWTECRPTIKNWDYNNFLSGLK